MKNVISFYLEGFRSMGLGRTLWKIILIKLAVLYLLAKTFFPDYLNANFSTDAQRADHVLTNLTNRLIAGE